MKIKLSNNSWVTIAIVIYIIAVVALYLAESYTPYRSPVNGVANNLKPFDNLLPDTATYYDKSTNTTTKYSIINKNLIKYNSESGSQFFFIGATGGFSCDTCSVKQIATRNDTDEVHKKYYIKLPYWKIKNTSNEFWYADSVKFHTENNHSYLRKVVIGSPSSNKNDRSYKYHLEDIPVKFEYDQTNQCLLIPVSKSVKKNLQVFLFVMFFVLLVYILYLIRSFLGLIFDLSKGLAFTELNIFRLKLIAASLILYPIIVFLLNLLMRLVFFSYFTADVVMSNSIWQDFWKPIGTGLIFLLLYRAFTQGKILKEEQELTI